MSKAWPFCGYAPGKYFNKCSTCGVEFTGDKRAVNCLECAVIYAKRTNDEIKKSLKYSQDRAAIDRKYTIPTPSPVSRSNPHE